MTTRRQRVFSVAGVLGCLLAPGCGRHAPLRPTPGPASSATLPELLERLGRDADVPSEFTADLNLTFEDLRSGRRHQVGLKLAARPPSLLRLQGRKALLPSLFVLIANPEGVWLDIPSRKRTYTRGPGVVLEARDGAAKTVAAFDPADFFAAIRPAPPAPDEAFALEQRPDAYVLAGFRPSGAGWAPTRRLLFSRLDLGLAEQELFGAGGKLLSVTRFGPRAPGKWFAAHVRLERPFEGVVLEFEPKAEHPSELPEGAFRFRPVPGHELIDLGTADGEAIDPLGSGAPEEQR